MKTKKQRLAFGQYPNSRIMFLNLLFLAALFLAACGSDSSSGVDTTETSEVKTVYGLGDCKGSNEGVTKLVTSENRYYTCADGQWSVSGAYIDTVKTDDDLPACLSKNEGDSAFVLSEMSVFRCQSSKWKNSGFVMGWYETKSKLPACEEKFDGLKGFVKNDSAVYVCDGEAWEAWADAYASEDDLPNCSSRRDGALAWLLNRSLALVCEEGSWDNYVEQSSKSSSFNNSSSSDNGKVTISCKVEKENPLTIKSSVGAFSGTIIYDLNKDGKVVETYEISSEAVAKDECEQMKKDAMYGEITCTGKMVVGVYNETYSDTEFQDFVEMKKEVCMGSDGKTGKLDDNNGTDFDDEDDDGREFLDNPPSCNFDADANEWGYSYSTGKDASGISSATDVEYRIEGKDLVQVTTVESVGSIAKMACSSVKDTDSEYKDEYVSKKIETTCIDDGMISKTTFTNYSYMDKYTKEQVLSEIKATCEAI